MGRARAAPAGFWDPMGEFPAGRADGYRLAGEDAPVFHAGGRCSCRNDRAPAAPAPVRGWPDGLPARLQPGSRGQGGSGYRTGWAVSEQRFSFEYHQRSGRQRQNVDLAVSAALTLPSLPG